MGERKKEGTGGLVLKIMSIVQESHQNKVEGKDLEGMVQKEIIRVYEKAEGAESSETEEEERIEGEEGRAESLEPPRSRTRSGKRRRKRPRNEFWKNQARRWWQHSMQMSDQMRGKQLRRTVCRNGQNRQESG